jgi:hypothetical protein
MGATVHCNENSIYVFPFWELRSLSPNFHLHVSVSDLYIPRIGPHTVFPTAQQADRSWEYLNRHQTHECVIGTVAAQFLFLGIFVSNFRHWFFAE